MSFLVISGIGTVFQVWYFPSLKEIASALGLADDRASHLVVEFGIRLCGGLHESAPRLDGTQRPDPRILEEVLNGYPHASLFEHFHHLM
ncbi:MAG: hypothetical protein OXF78_03385 [Rhodospirillales bacterium]|nr:hypothetical protein [Rhodospirillales bacterium]